ncbi:hypothetical protein H4R33_007214, partial [Dimargaris cristalligena]
MDDQLPLSASEIEAENAKRILNKAAGSDNTILLAKQPGATVLLSDNGVVIKKGSRVAQHEVQMMDMARSVGVPVPRVIRAYESTDEGFIIEMEHVPGVTLKSVFESLNGDELDRI